MCFIGHQLQPSKMINEMENNKMITPVLKWAGGKRQLLETFRPLLPKQIATYCEPFIGGGALFFYLQPNIAFINDINPELIRVYIVIRDNVEELIFELGKFENTAEQFYSVRAWDRNKDYYATLSDTKKAARVLYLNKTCFNGVYRVNRAGEFNSPFGNYRNPNIVNAPMLRSVSAYLNAADIHITTTDYADVLKNVPRGAFVYLDPPYDPVSKTSSFTGYSRYGFSREDQIQLRKCCDELTTRGIKFMLSNADTKFITEEYEAYNITIVQAKRTVNAVASKRGDVNEVVIRNYE